MPWEISLLPSQAGDEESEQRELLKQCQGRNWQAIGAAAVGFRQKGLGF